MNGCRIMLSGTFKYLDASRFYTYYSPLVLALGLIIAWLGYRADVLKITHPPDTGPLQCLPGFLNFLSRCVTRLKLREAESVCRRRIMPSCLLSQKGSLLGSPSLNEEPLSVPLLTLDDRMPTQPTPVSRAHADCGLRHWHLRRYRRSAQPIARSIAETWV